VPPSPTSAARRAAGHRRHQVQQLDQPAHRQQHRANFTANSRMKTQNQSQRTTQKNNSSFPSFLFTSLIEKEEGRKEFLVFIGVLLLLNR
jgi:hypothetical protein